ncbi:MAG: PHP domain-containing protein [Chloroflexi bacterium]|nr:PHP domain-containing protein [Acidimicrobiia bacterium]MCY4618278.1 PHP domain-containing protein [Chloroflexota bacterium]
MEPVRALRQAIHYLDRELALAQKIRAFQRAVEVVQQIGEAETVQRAAAGTLTELNGIGRSTAAVIAEALDGETDGYLARLDERTRVPTGVGGPVMQAIRGDCHTHSTASDGSAPVRDMAETAIALGHEWMVVTDHSARLTIAHGLDEERLASQLDEIETLNSELAPFRILTGMEVDIFEDGTLDLSDEMLARLDLVVASVHSKMRLPADVMTRRMVTAVANPHTDVLGHLTNRKLVGTGRPPSDFDPEIVFAACARFDTAVEINCRPERQDPPEELLEIAVRWGCKIAIDSDAHATGQLEWQPYGADKAVRCGVPVTNIINTWHHEDLLAWTASHAA